MGRWGKGSRLTRRATSFQRKRIWGAGPRSASNNLVGEKSMTRVYTTAIVLLVAGAAYAQVTLNSVRVGAKDTVALAKFYQAAFGMQETNRIDATGGPEIFVNFGAPIAP